MIHLTPSTAIILYLAITLGSLFTLWGWCHYHTRKKKVLIAREKLHICEYCACPYLASNDATVSRCPQCHSYNAPTR